MNIFDRVKSFIIQKYLEFEPSLEIDLDTRLSRDLDIEGDDAVDFFEKFEDEFKVDLSNLNLDIYFHGEGVDPLDLIVGLFKSNRKETITVRDLVECVESGQWVSR
ncbi:MAG TPA: DUF1493 family protein [Dyadobacter sp.]|jgi:acyl carrier protein|nr:DUF1493 family protein [Dyadobacter sp.]